MKLTGNTMLITGGGTGIGRGLAEQFHKLGNQVVIAGRRREALEATTAANPGMKSLTVDMQDAGAIRQFAMQAVAEFPALNVVINNAGIMRQEKLIEADVTNAETIVATSCQTARGHADKRVVGSGVSSAYPYANVLRDEGRDSLVHDEPAPSVARHEDRGAGAGAAVCADGSDGRSERSAGNAAERVYYPGDGDSEAGTDTARNPGAAREAAAICGAEWGFRRDFQNAERRPHRQQPIAVMNGS